MSSKKHLLPNQHFRLVVCLPRLLTLKPLADRNLRQANILHDGPDDGQATRFGREDVNLIGALAHIAKPAFIGVGAANVAVHDWWEGRERKQMLFVFAEAANSFGIALLNI